MASSDSDNGLKKCHGSADTPTSYDNDNNSGAGPSSSTPNGKRRGGSNDSKPAKKQRVDSDIDSLDEDTVSVGSEALDKKGSYSKSGLTNSLHGVIYQLKHLMLILKLAWDKGYSFRLATEMDAAEKFDDLVYEYEDIPGSRKHQFVQLKHKQDGSTLISVRELLADDEGDFSLIKYFRSWSKIKKHPDFAESESKRFILCTNIGLNKEKLEEENIEVREVNELDDFSNITPDKSQCYKLIPDSQSKLYDVLKSASDLHQLAKVLATCVRSSKALFLNIDIFNCYHVALAHHVLVDIDSSNAKLRDEFIDNTGLSPKAVEFRKIFYKYVSEFPDSKKASETDIWNRLKRYRFKKSANFGKVSPSSKSQLVDLPDDIISDQDISDFFQEFILAVNQPNEEQLDKLIEDEFGECSQFNLLNANFVKNSFQNDVLNWFKSKRGEYLVREDAMTFFDDLKRQLSSLIAVGLNSPYPQKLEKYDVKYENSNEELKEFLESPDLPENRILLQHTYSEQTLLTALRIYQTIKSMEQYTKDDSFIFIELDNLLLPKITRLVFRAFSSPANHNLLIIDCGLHSADLNTDELWKKMCHTMKESRAKKITGKRIIIIIPQKDTGIVKLGLLPCIRFDETEDDISIDTMKRSTRRKLLEKEVIEFQGRDEKTSYGCLLGGENFATEEVEKIKDYRKIMNPETLVRIICGTKLKIGMELEGLGEVKDFYISRTMDRHVVIKNDIFKSAQGRSDIFAIGGIDETTLQKLWEDENRKGVDSSQEGKHQDPKKYVILQNGREKDDFDTHCQEKPGRIIHWLQRESGKLVWKKSHGSIVNLMKYREETKSDGDAEKLGVIPLTEEEQADCRDNQPKIIILSDTAGMGKSTVLTRLAKMIRDNDPNLLVIKINLNDHTKVLKTEQNRRFDSHDFNDAVDFLVDKLIPGLEPEAVFLFKTMIKARRRAALFFDGFDEISPYYKETVINLIRTLSKLEVKKLFVTTRPHTSRDLEEKLGEFSHTLQPFSEANQSEFLTKFWKSRSGSSKNEDGMERHAQRLIALLTKTIDRSMQEFTGVPLQTRMVAEVYPYDEGSESIQGSTKTRTIIDLYDAFVKKKYNIYTEDKSDRDSTKPDYMENYPVYLQTFSNKHHKFSLDVLFDVKTVELLMGHQYSDTITDEAMTRKGMIIQFIDGKPQFIHRTFAEYFAAKFLFKLLMDNSPNQQVREFFVGHVFLKSEYRVIRAFLNCLLADEDLVGQENSWKFYLKDQDRMECETVYHVAAKERHYGIVRFLLNRLTEDSRLQFSNINCLSRTRTPLAIAVEAEDNFEIVKCFVDAGADINHGNWPRFELAKRSDVIFDVIEYLIEKSTQEVKPEIITSALFIAAEMGKLDLVKYLIRKGANFASHAQEKCNTPLHLAAESGRQDVVQYLIEMGANVDSHNCIKQTPLHLAVESRELGTVKNLVRKTANIDHRDTFGYSPLRLAAGHLFEDANRCYATQLAVVQCLLDNGADINSHTNDGDTLLHNAASSGNFRLLQFSLDKGIIIDSQRFKDGKTALHMATELYDMKIVKHLITRGANVNSLDNCGRTVMHYVSDMDTTKLPIKFDQLGLIKYLREEGADIHSETRRGETALYFAAKRDNIDLVKYFREQNANIHVKTRNGEILLHAAVEHGSIAIMEYLIGKGLDVQAQTEGDKTLLYYAAAFNRLDLVKFFKEKSANINSETKKGKTPLHEASRRGHLDIIEYLIENGADIRSRTHDGRTCMHYAARSGKLDVVEYLADKGVDIHSPSDDGTTPLHSAAMCYNARELQESFRDAGIDINDYGYQHHISEEAALQVVKFLTNKGANIDYQTRDGWTPLHLAAKGNALRVVMFLENEGADIHRQTRDGKRPLQVATEHQAINVQNYLKRKLEGNPLPTT